MIFHLINLCFVDLSRHLTKPPNDKRSLKHVGWKARCYDVVLRTEHKISEIKKNSLSKCTAHLLKIFLEIWKHPEQIRLILCEPSASVKVNFLSNSVNLSGYSSMHFCVIFSTILPHFSGLVPNLNSTIKTFIGTKALGSKFHLFSEEKLLDEKWWRRASTTSLTRLTPKTFSNLST